MSLQPHDERRPRPHCHVSTVIVNGHPAETADDALALSMMRHVLDDLFAPTSDIPEVLLDESRWGDEEYWQGGEE